MRLHILLMKRITISDVVAGFSDKPISIGDRLATLGIPPSEAKKNFTDQILNTEVYASSFAKFLQDNADKLDDKIPGKELPEDYLNPFDANKYSIGERLLALGIAEKDINDLFDKTTLNLELSGDEFQAFIVKNKTKFLDKIQKLSTKGG